MILNRLDGQATNKWKKNKMWDDLVMQDRQMTFANRIFFLGLILKCLGFYSMNEPNQKTYFYADVQIIRLRIK